MPLTGHVIQQHRGSYLKLIFTLKCGNGKDRLDSREFIVDDLAKVRFKFHMDADVAVHCEVSSMKQPAAKDSCIKMCVSCDTPKYSEMWTCHNEWTDWKNMGKVCEGANEDPVSSPYYMFLVNINVRKLKDVSPHASVYRDKEFRDFELCVAGGHVAVHKVFLAAHSEEFRRLLKGEWKKAGKGLIDLEDVTQATLDHLANYLYLGVLPEDNLLTLLLLAKRYVINNLKNDCILELAQNITAENLYSYLKFACKHDIPELAFAILQRTPDDVVHSVSLLMKRKEEPLHEEGDEI